jgi:hypothetical protein
MIFNAAPHRMRDPSEADKSSPHSGKLPGIKNSEAEGTHVRHEASWRLIFIGILKAVQKLGPTP